MMNLDTLLKTAKNIQLFILDVDGILTNGTMFVDDNNAELRGFHAHDTLGLKLLQKTELPIAIITGRNSQIVYNYARLIGIDYVYQGHLNKLPSYEDLKKKLKLSNDQIAYIGDDVTDLPLIQRAGIGITVPDAIESVKKSADWITQKHGGHGAVREICDFLMQAQDTIKKAYAAYEMELC